VNVPPHLADTPETRADLALYYDAIARMDRGLGEMLGELERRNLRRNTLVVFLSDNGAPFPREKGTLYDSGTRTPLILSWPDVIPDGSVYDRGLVSLVDLAPTILELAPERARDLAGNGSSVADEILGVAAGGRAPETPH
jgi:N-sulfoglucosamine sulfohydrolase